MVLHFLSFCKKKLKIYYCIILKIDPTQKKIHINRLYVYIINHGDKEY